MATPLELKLRALRTQPVDVVSDFPTKKARIAEEINIEAQNIMNKKKDKGESIPAVIKKGKGKKVSMANPHLHKPKHKLLGGLN